MAKRPKQKRETYMDLISTSHTLCGQPHGEISLHVGQIDTDTFKITLYVRGENGIVIEQWSTAIPIDKMIENAGERQIKKVM